VVVGETNSFGTGSNDAYLSKTDPGGDLQWTRTYGGSDLDFGYSVQQTQDQGYVIAGVTYSFGAGASDVYLIKTDATGNLRWSRAYGGEDWDYGYSVQQTSDQGYIVTGGTYSFGSGNSDVYLIKTDSLGGILWTRTYGGSDYEYGNSVKQTEDGGFIVTGQTFSFGSGNSDVYLIKTDASGMVLWSHTYGGGDLDYGHSVQQTTDGGYITAGATYSFGRISSDGYLVKTDSIGNLKWSRAYGGDDTDYGYSVQQTAEGGYVVAGYGDFTSAGGRNVTLTKLDSLGNTCFGELVSSLVKQPSSSVTNPATVINDANTTLTMPLTVAISPSTEVTTVCQELFINYPPEFDSCPSPETVLAGDTLRLFISASDSNSSDTLTLTRYPKSLGTFPDSIQGIAIVEGEFVWIPDTADTHQTHQIFFYVSDQNGAEDTCGVQIEVKFNYPPQFDFCPSQQTAFVGDTLKFTLSASDQNSDDILTLTRSTKTFGTFPDSIQGIGVVEGEFVWVADTADTQTTPQISFYVSDQNQAMDTCMVTIQVRINNPPEIYLEPPFSDTTIYEGETLSFFLYATDQDLTDTLTLTRYPTSFGTFPDDIQGVGEVTGEFIWTPGYGQVGEDSILFKVIDGKAADSVYVKITVENKVLKVISHYPHSDEEDVLIDDRIMITLSEPIKFETVNSSSFKIVSRADSSLEGIILIDYLTDKSILTFRLPPGSMYSILDTVTVTLTTDILDSADYGMPEDYFWEFYTGIGVYPGNTNNDLIVDERDILPLGFYWGKTGPSRGKGYKNTSWSIKPAHRWTADSSWEPYSAVHADADGNGKVDEWDICGVAVNWDSTLFESLRKIPEDFLLFKENYKENLSIYQKMYNALLNCPESKGKKQIKGYLEKILEQKQRPTEFEIFQNYPNPFNSKTVIRYSLPRDCHVEISLFNILGQKIKTLVNEYQTSGYKKTIWDGRNDQGKEVGSGIYFYRMKAASFSSTRKMLFVK